MHPRPVTVIALLLACFLGWTDSSHAIDPSRPLRQLKLDHWGVDQGLPHPSVGALLQTRDGFLWVGTLRGLARYDGAQFVEIRSITRQASVIRNIVALAETPDGSIWIGTYGSGLIRYRRDSVSVFSWKQGFPANDIRTLLADSNGTIWAGTTSAGLVRFSAPYRKEDVFTFTQREGLPGKAVNDLAFGPDGLVWAATEGGVAVIRDNAAAAVPVPAHQSRGSIFAIGSAPMFGMLLSADEGLFSYRRPTGALLIPSPGSRNDYYTCVRADRDGNLWTGSYLSGIFRWSPGTASATQLTRKDGLAGNYIGCILEDREGSLWIGTEDGLDRLRDASIRTIADREGITHETAISLAEDRSGTVWVGTDGGGLYRIREGGAAEHVGPDRGLSDAYISTLTVDRNNRILIGTGHSGVFVLDGDRLRPTLPDVRGMPIVVVTEARDGDLLVAAEHQFVRWHRNRRTVVDTGDGLPHGVLRAVLEDRQGRIWIGTEAGLCCLEGDHIRSYSEADGLPDDYITTLHEDSTGSLWVGTSAGLVRFEGERRRRFGVDEGLPDPSVSAIVEDGLGHFWFATPRGIARVARTDVDAVSSGTQHSLHARIFGVADGMKTAECSDVGFPAGIRRRNGEIWFTTARGVAVINPRSFRVGTPVITVVIEDILTDDGRRRGTTDVVLGPGENRFSIPYTAPTFLQAGQLRFRYRLEGFDEDWIDAGGRRTAVYANVPPGTYTFAVAVRETEHGPEVSGASLSLTIEPRFYQQTWFFLAGVLAATLGVAGIISLRVRKAEQRSRKLSALVDARTRELREEIAERERVENALRHSEAQQNAILLRMPVVLYSARTPHEIDAEWISQNVERVTGFPPSSFTKIPHFWISRLHPDDLSVMETQTRALRSGSPIDCEYRWQCADGSYRWFLDHVVSVQALEGGMFEYLGVLLDVTERREAAERLKASLREKEVLLKEIHHRVKNNLTVINSLLSLQASTLDDPATKGVLMEAAHRVGSMAAIHEQLYQSTNLAAIDFRAYVDRLVSQLLRTYGLGHISFDLDINGVFFEVNVAIPCGLIINELVTNSLKYAFADRTRGRIEVRITVAADGYRTLVVHDDGIGLREPVDFSSVSSLGLRLVSLLAQQLGGQAEITSRNGTTCTVTFPPPVSPTAVPARA